MLAIPYIYIKTQSYNIQYQKICKYTYVQVVFTLPVKMKYTSTVLFLSN